MRLPTFFYPRWVGIAVIFILPWLLFAQQTEDLVKMNLDDILDLDVAVFSAQGLTQRQTPGVFTVITEEEISQSGARDLVDLLRRVPGFEFGLDLQGVISLGIRGHWAHEGKVLMMIDGMQMNEILFSCLSFGGHYPVEAIQRIEIIRGPGTSFFGGYAELAVINVITKTDVHLNGVESSTTYGRTSSAESRLSVGLNTGWKVQNAKLKILASGGRSLFSDRDYVDVYGNSFPMKTVSTIRPNFLTAGVNWNGLKANVLFDRYTFGQQDAYVSILDQPIDVSFHTVAGQIGYDIRLGSKMTLTPGCVYLRQEPWKSTGQEALNADFYYYTIADRLKPTLVLKGTLGDAVQFISGIETLMDRAHVAGDTPVGQTFSGDSTKTKVNYRQVSAFTQAFYTKGSTIPSLGLRYDNHNQFGAAFLPWMGVTQMIGKWSLKTLFGRTFRAPSIENVNINPSIKPETNTTFELECGYQLNDYFIMILDLYRTSIHDPIVYSLDPQTEEEIYRNYGSSGSWGIEFESKYKADWGRFNFSYSWYRPYGIIEEYRVDGHPHLFLGFPAHKVVFNGTWIINPKFCFSPSLVFTSRRFGYASADADSSFLLKEFKPTLLGDLFFQTFDVFGSSWDVGFGVYNVFNVNHTFIQPYNSGHAPMPGLSREFVVRLKYRWNW